MSKHLRPGDSINGLILMEKMPGGRAKFRCRCGTDIECSYEKIRRGPAGGGLLSCGCDGRILSYAEVFVSLKAAQGSQGLTPKPRSRDDGIEGFNALRCKMPLFADPVSVRKCVRAIANSRIASVENGYAPCNASIEDLIDAITGDCAICGAPEEGAWLCMDHCHSTGNFRGWLCDVCNRGLGGFGDSPAALRLVAEYLDDPKGQEVSGYCAGCGASDLCSHDSRFCHRCNVAVARFDDDPSLLRRAAEYLEAAQARHAS